MSEYSQEGGRVTQLHIVLLHAQKPRTNLGIRKKDHSPLDEVDHESQSFH